MKKLYVGEDTQVWVEGLDADRIVAAMPRLRPATRRETLRFQLTRARFNWIELVVIVAFVDFVRRIIT